MILVFELECRYYFSDKELDKVLKKLKGFDEKDKKLEIFREYDSKSGIETTKDVKSNFNGLKDIYEFSQKFFTKEEIIDLTTGFRDYDIVSSFDVNSRKNNQKHILVLKR